MGLPSTGDLAYTKDMNNTQRLNRRQSAEAIRQRLAFSNSTGSLRGYKRTETYDPGQHMTGRLNADERARFLSDSHYGIDYLVVSYDTPIAWITSDGTKYRVSQKFSQTTSCHMGLTWQSDSAKVEA